MLSKQTKSWHLEQLQNNRKFVFLSLSVYTASAAGPSSFQASMTLPPTTLPVTMPEQFCSYQGAPTPIIKEEDIKSECAMRPCLEGKTGFLSFQMIFFKMCTKFTLFLSILQVVCPSQWQVQLWARFEHATLPLMVHAHRLC